MSLQGELAEQVASFQCKWRLSQIIAEEVDEEEVVVQRVIKLIQESQAIPFIARYRREATNNMDITKLRDIFRLHEELINVKSKAEFVAKQLHNQAKLTYEILVGLQRATTTTEIEHIFLPFKKGCKTTLAERAKEAGLEAAADSFLKHGFQFCQSFVNPRKKGCATEDEVMTGIKHLVADKISKDPETLSEIRLMVKFSNARLEVSPCGALLKKDDKLTPNSKQKKENKKMEAENFSQYFERQRFPLSTIQPHHVLAINRAEGKKVMSVKVVFNPNGVSSFMAKLESKWVPKDCGFAERKFWKSIIKDAYDRLLLPFIIREERSRLSKEAEKASIDVFMENLKRILLAPPVMGKVIMGVDPGYSHGCKIAVISEISEILQTCVIFVHNEKSHKYKQEVIKLLQRLRCDTIAIGNGTASRETEAFFSEVIKSSELQDLNCHYCIVNENGASIYSVSPLAEKEMPDLDPNLRSAVSIARRLQNPLAELVKIEPKHLGVGMYQHDVSKTHLKKALDSIVEECVSFVGVDINSCSEELLQYVAGVGPSMAAKMIKHRCAKGPFKNREQLRSVKGLGEKTFQQCAGFIRVSRDIIIPPERSSEDEQEKEEPSGKRKGKSSSGRSKKKQKISDESNPLDKTWIHPESYQVTQRLLGLADADLQDIGGAKMREKLISIKERIGLKSLAENLSIGEPTLQLILDGLMQPQNFDLRSEFEKPVFRKGLMSVEDLRIGMQLPGRVTNKVHFGAFVDIGVGSDGLLHVSQIKSYLLPKGKELGPGDRVQVAVTSVERNASSHRKCGKVKIGLRLVAVL